MYHAVPHSPRRRPPHTSGRTRKGEPLRRRAVAVQRGSLDLRVMAPAERSWPYGQSLPGYMIAVSSGVRSPDDDAGPNEAGAPAAPASGTPEDAPGDPTHH